MSFLGTEEDKIPASCFLVLRETLSIIYLFERICDSFKVNFKFIIFRLVLWDSFSI